MLTVIIQMIMQKINTFYMKASTVFALGLKATLSLFTQMENGTVVFMLFLHALNIRHFASLSINKITLKKHYTKWWP